MTPSVSVVIPTYNREKLVLDALASVARQGLKNVEIIVVDDGSTDKTGAAVAGFARGFPDGQVRYIHQENQGPSHARNVGITEARAPYVAFLDADDVWADGSLKERVDFLKAHPDLALVFADVERYNKDGKLESSSYFREKRGYHDLVRRADHIPGAFDLFLRENFITLSTVVVRKDVLMSIGLFDESLGWAEDLDLWLRIAAHHKIGCIPKPMLVRRMHGGNISDNWFATASCNIRVLNKLKRSYPEHYLRNKKQIKDKLCGFHQAVGYIHFQQKEMDFARRHFLKSIRNKPTRKSFYYLALSLLGPRAVTHLRGLKASLSAN